MAACLCGALPGCALAPMAMLAAPAAQGAVALSLGPLADMHERATTDPCEMSTSAGRFRDGVAGEEQPPPTKGR